MSNAAVKTAYRIPLYQVLHKPLTEEEVKKVIDPTLHPPFEVIEIAFSIDGIGPARAVGIFQGSTKVPMQHLFLRCDYHSPIDHFVAIEADQVERMMQLFPDRFKRVWGVYETPYQ